MLPTWILKLCLIAPLNNLQIKPRPTADYHYTMVNNSAWICNFVQQYLGSVHEFKKEFAHMRLP